jgi:molybdopterin synthase catalytic subunit/RimJ/RimL family protein N-acetyltransferase
MDVRQIQFDADRAEWLRMRHALWPHYPTEEIQAEAEEIATGRTGCGHPSAVFIVDRGNGKLGGFIELALRVVADGCVTSPVGYIEGWYVDDDLRKQGMGKALVAAGEAWAREQGCADIASDCLSHNDVSHAAHRAIGYQHANRHIRFRKSLTPTPRTTTGEDCIGLMSVDLSVATAVKLVTDARAGGIDVFLGTTRAETSAEGRELIALDYEAYEQMAAEQLRDLARRAQEQWPIVKLALLHRTGRVAVGEPSVIIAVSTPHRADSFAACKWLIDTLKKDVAIWKKEVWADGSGTWVHPDNSGQTPKPR